MKKLKVGLDLDGVVYQFIEYFDKFAESKGISLDKTDYNRGLDESKIKPILEDFGKLRPFLWIPTYPGVQENLQRLSKKYDFHIITFREWIKEGRQDTIKRLREDKISYKSLHFGKRKYELCNKLGLDLFIEDSLNNCKKIRDNSDTHPILIDRPYNQGDTTGIMRIKSLGDLL